MRASSKVPNCLPPLSQVTVSGAEGTSENDLPPNAQSVAEWWKSVAMTAIAGPVGVLALLEVPAKIQDVVDRWANGGSLIYALPLTVLLGLLFVVALIVLVGMCCAQLKRKYRSRWTPHVHVN